MAGKNAIDLEADWELEHKVTRSLEIMGEAASRISYELKNQFPDVPWKEMKNLRNRVIHQYFEIDYKKVFLITSRDIPSLKEQLENILQQLQDKQEPHQVQGCKDDPISELMPREEKEKGQGKKM